MEYIYSQKKNIVSANFTDPTQLILSFNDLITTQVLQVQSFNKIGDRAPYIK
ncbi:MAG: hypothetical protein WCG98_00245 [bacterium]